MTANKQSGQVEVEPQPQQSQKNRPSITSRKDNLERVITDMTLKDYSYLYTRQHALIEDIELLLKDWDIYHEQYEDTLRRFAHVYKAKIEPFLYFRHFYEGLYQMVKKMERKLNFRASPREANVPREEHDTDRYYNHFLNEQIKKESKTTLYFIHDEKGKRELLRDLMAKTKEYAESAETYRDWQDILEKTAVVAQNNCRKKNTYEQINWEAQIQFMKRLEYQALPDPSCLGCTRFMLKDFNLFNPFVANSQIALLGNIKVLKEDGQKGDNNAEKQKLKEKARMDIRREIEAMSNSQGGVLLFNVERAYLSVLPKGEEITEDDKTHYIQEIRKIVESIPSALKMEEDVSVTFVPVTQNPIQKNTFLQTSLSDAEKVNFLRGCYVCRVAVKSHQQRTGSPALPKRQGTLFSDEDTILTTASTNISQHAHTQVDDGDTKSDTSTEDDFQEHRCGAPMAGEAIAEALNHTDMDDPQKKYKYMSLIVVKHEHHDTIITLLKNKHQIDVMVTTPFKKKYPNTKGVNTSALLFHNEPFDRLLSLISYKTIFKFDERFLMLIELNEYIKMPTYSGDYPILKKTLHALHTRFSAEFPNEMLHMWKWEEDDDEYEIYFSTESPLSLYFFYLLLTDLGEKASFNGPKYFNVISKREKAKRMKEVKNSIMIQKEMKEEQFEKASVKDGKPLTKGRPSQVN